MDAGESSFAHYMNGTSSTDKIGSVTSGLIQHSVLLPKLLNECPENISGIKIFDSKRNKEITLDEYEKEY